MQPAYSKAFAPEAKRNYARPMIRNYESILGSHVIHQENGSILGLVEGLIVNPDSGKLEAFWVRPAEQPFSHAIVQSQNVAEWKKHLYVKDESALADPTQIIRIADILAQNRPILGNRVENENGQSYGKVVGADINDQTGYVHQIQTQKSLLGLFGYKKRIFSYSKIVEVLPSKIIVSDDASQKEANIISPAIKDSPDLAV